MSKEGGASIKDRPSLLILRNIGLSKCAKVKNYHLIKSNIIWF